jgi:hypothetical protein
MSWTNCRASAIDNSLGSEDSTMLLNSIAMLTFMGKEIVRIILSRLMV